MDTDVRTLLSDAAPQPSGELDVEGVVSRGARLRRVRRATITTALAVVIAATVVVVPKLVPPRPPTIVGTLLADELRGELDETFAAAVRALDLPGAAAAIVFDDGRTWTATAGIVGDEASSSVQPSTAFSLGHLTEIVTMAALADLVHEGVVTVEDRVSRWLPQLPTDATVADLLYHRSGLPDIVDLLGAEWTADPARIWTADEVLAEITAAEAPGAYAQSDTDAIVLGRLVEVADGRPLSEIVAERVLRPLSAGRVGFQPLAGTTVARPFEVAVDPSADPRVPWTAWATANEATTGMVGTAEDTARLLHALLVEEAGADHRETLLDWWSLPDERAPQRGAAGLVRGFDDGWREVWRASTSGTPGFRAGMLHIPDLNATVVVMANRGFEREAGGLGPDVPGLLDAVADVLLDATITSASSVAPGRGQVWIAGADGSDPRPLTDSPGQALPLDWSPDGRWLLVQSDRDGDWDLWLVARDGSEFRQVTNEPGMESFARFSPDGRRIAFTDNLAVDADLWVVGVDGQGMAKVAGGDGTDEWNPTWSPDGEALVFARTRRDDRSVSDLWTVRPDGGGLRRLEVGRPGLVWADWSGDGSRLLGGTVDGTLVTFLPDGKDPRAVEGVDRAWHPRWGPDGTIVFAHGGSVGSDGLLGAGPQDARDLWRVGRDDRVIPWLVRAGDQSLPVWSPDGTLVAFAETSSGGS